jgi:hypothetical protein
LADLRESEPKIINLTVEDAAAAGLPAPVPAAAGAVGTAKSAGAGDPQHDPVLREAEHIMADYVSLAPAPAPLNVAAIQ